MKLTIIAFTGMMGSGKTTLADYLAKEKGFEKRTFASPIYRISKLVHKQIKDDEIASYELFDLLVSLFGGYNSSPPFVATASIAASGLKNLADETGMMKDIGNGRKPRRFLQKTGDYFRSFNEKIYANYMRRNILAEVRDAREDYFQSLDGKSVIAQNNDNNKPPELKIVIDDLRFNEEAEELINAVTQANELYNPINIELRIIRLDIQKDIAIKRVALRDGLDEHSVKITTSHISENGIKNIFVDETLDTNESLREVIRNLDSLLSGKKNASLGEESVVEEAMKEFKLEDDSNLIDLSKFKKGEDNG